MFVPEQSRRSRQVVRKEAGERTVPLDPAITGLPGDSPGPYPPGRGRRRRAPAGGPRAAARAERPRVRLPGPADPSRRVPEGGMGSRCRGVAGPDDRGGPPRGRGAGRCSVWPSMSGTTTIAAYLTDLASGEVLATESAMNPQVAFGDDLIARLHHVAHHPEGLAELQRTVIDEVNGLAARAVKRVGAARTDIFDVVMVGNTAMHHLFLGLETRALGVAPFAPAIQGPVDTLASAVGLDVQPRLPPARPARRGRFRRRRQRGRDHRRRAVQAGQGPADPRHRHQRRAGAGQPGAHAVDLVRHRPGLRGLPHRVRHARRAGRHRAHPHRARRPSTCASRSSASRAGRRATLPRRWAPAASADRASSRQPRRCSRPGSSCPTATSIPELTHERVVYEDGKPRKFVIAWAEETAIGRPITVSLKDIRSLQLAKAALRAGEEILLRRYGVDKPDGVIMAGAFGTYIDKHHALAIGMLPDCDPDIVTSVGNAAGDGARFALLNLAEAPGSGVGGAEGGVRRTGHRPRLPEGVRAGHVLSPDPDHPRGLDTCRSPLTTAPPA